MNGLGRLSDRFEGIVNFGGQVEIEAWNIDPVYLTSFEVHVCQSQLKATATRNLQEK